MLIFIFVFFAFNKSSKQYLNCTVLTCDPSSRIQGATEAAAAAAMCSDSAAKHNKSLMTLCNTVIRLVGFDYTSLLRTICIID